MRKIILIISKVLRKSIIKFQARVWSNEYSTQHIHRILDLQCHTEYTVRLRKKKMKGGFTQVNFAGKSVNHKNKKTSGNILVEKHFPGKYSFRKMQRNLPPDGEKLNGLVPTCVWRR